MDKAKVASFLENLDYGPAPESAGQAQAWLKLHNEQFGHFVGGSWHTPSDGTYFETLDPAHPDNILAKVAQGSPTDVDAAVQAARRAFEPWSSLAGHIRARYLYAIARAIARHSRILAVLESLDNGKTIRETRDIDVPLVIRHFYYHAGWAQLMDREFPGHRPGGVVAQIIPWNFPLLMLAWKIAPAIAAGNTVVLKPAEFTPLSALYFAELLINEVKLPPGVINIVTGDGQTGRALVEHPVPWKIAFTGSTEVGRLIRSATAGTGKHLTLELGGKSPFIVFDNADLDSAIEGVVNGIWFNQGQVCCAGSRMLVQESISAEFIDRLKQRMSKLRSGTPLDKAMDMGAINSAPQLEKILRLTKLGQEQGAVMWQPPSATGAKSPESCESGYFFPPTLFTEVQPSHTIAREEIFGPVLVSMTFRTPGEAVELANNTRYGLAASVWSQDIDLALDVARRIKAGTVWVNSTNLFDGASGFGGYRESGYGREGGREGMYEVLEEVFPPPTSEKRRSPKNGERVALTTEIDRTYRFLIGGKLVRPDAAGSFSITSPDGTFLGVVGEANRKDVRAAVEAARNASKAWGDSTAHNRAQILYFLAENLASQHDRFKDTVAAESGIRPEDAAQEVEMTVERLFHWAAMTDKFEGTVQPVPSRRLVCGLREAVGIIGMRAADEWPLLGLVSVIAPAAAMGNCVVAVAGRHALTSVEFIQVIQNSDVPAGVINILTASKPDDIALVIAEHEEVDAVWFFGSEAGSSAVERASIGNMKRTWTSNGRLFDWAGPQGISRRIAREATQVKNVWVPYGV